MNSHCTLLILTYKGKHHLEFLLPTVKTAIENTPNYKIDVLIVDNGQDEATRNYVSQNFPDYKFEFSPVNDYLFSLNSYVKKLKTEFVFILNDDMKLDEEVLNQTLPFLLKDKNLFAVTCNVRDWDDTYTAAFPRKLYYFRGWLSSKWEKENYENGLKFTLYAGGGAAVFRTSIFNEIGGFDSLLRPAYGEDLDLGHVAWHKGYKIIYNPKAILLHREGGTIHNQFKADKLTQNIYKNQILWMVKNGNYQGFLLWFLLLLPYRVLTGWKINKNSYIALLKSLPKIPLALIKRIKKPKPQISDKQLMKILNTEYKYETRK
ncbi:MAG: glycosyltransferase [Bacteroidales bacterium]|nr:glycosyltransferase [Bacteroidales bacterium]